MTKNEGEDCCGSSFGMQHLLRQTWAGCIILYASKNSSSGALVRSGRVQAQLKKELHDTFQAESSCAQPVKNEFDSLGVKPECDGVTTRRLPGRLSSKNAMSHIYVDHLPRLACSDACKGFAE
eukprot:1146805-Pelagomonas_calceolata.AAC.8